jgi:hypothetical protein
MQRSLSVGSGFRQHALCASPRSRAARTPDVIDFWMRARTRRFCGKAHRLQSPTTGCCAGLRSEQLRARNAAHSASRRRRSSSLRAPEEAGRICRVCSAKATRAQRQRSACERANTRVRRRPPSVDPARLGSARSVHCMLIDRAAWRESSVRQTLIWRDRADRRRMMDALEWLIDAFDVCVYTRYSIGHAVRGRKWRC